MESIDSKNRAVRIGLIVIVVILLLLGGIQLYFSFYLDSYVENRLTTAVREQTQGQYELIMDDLNLSVWGRKFEMQNLRLHPADDSSKAPKIDMNQFSINQIQFFPYLFNGAIHVGQVQLLGPKVSFVQNNPDSLTFLQSTDSSSNSSKSRVIEVDQFLIENGALTYWNQDQSSAKGELSNFHLDISDIRVDSTTQVNPLFFDFNTVQTRSGKIRYLLNNDLYAIETNGFNVSSSEGFVTIDSLKLVPQLPKYEFSQQVGHQQDRISIIVAGLRLENPDIEKLKSGELDADRFTIDRADLDVFHSKLLPRPPESVKTFPQEAFKEMPVPVRIDTIEINESEISYSEHRPDVPRPGTVTFANVNAKFSDVTNDSLAIARGDTIVLDVTSDVMGAAELDAHFDFPLNTNGGHSVRATLASMQAAQLNPILEPVGLVRAEDGTLHSLQFYMDLGSESATGWVQLVYSDLKIAVLDEDNVDGGGRQWLKTFLANVLKIKENNNEEPFRRGEVSKERVHTKSIFSYWWKSLSTGLKENVGI